MENNRFITTECGLGKFAVLRERKGFFNKLRFYWFVIFASIRDQLGPGK